MGQDAGVARGAGVRRFVEGLRTRWRAAARGAVAMAIAAAGAGGAFPTPDAMAQAQGKAPVTAATPVPAPRFTNSKATLAPGAMMVITWRNLPRPSGSDMVALYQAEAPIDEFITWAYMSSCRQSLAVPTMNWTTASCSVQVPDPAVPGSYEWRVLRTLAYGQRHEIWRFPAFAVTAPTKPNGRPYDTAVTTKSAAAVGGDLVVVQWKDVADPTPGDWIGLFDADDDSDLAPLVAQPTSCDLEVPRALEAGTCELGVPFDAVPGTYVVRLFTVVDGLNQLLATSEPVQVDAPPPGTTPPAPMFTLRATPTPRVPTPVPAAEGTSP